jgi:HK97 family phage major capsid protein
MEIKLKNEEQTKEPIDELEDAINQLVEIGDTKDKEVVTGGAKIKTAGMSGVNRKMRWPQENGVILPTAQIRSADQLSWLELEIERQIFTSKNCAMPEDHERRLEALTQKRLMTSVDAGVGEEIAEVDQSVALLRDFYLPTVVASNIPTIQMPTGKMKLSMITSEGASFYKPTGEGVAVTASDLATMEAPFVAYVLKSQVDVSMELEEDSIIALLPQLRAILLQNASAAIDEAILNADASTGTQNINYYAASGGSNIDTASRFLLGFDGLIHLALNEASGMTVDVGTLDEDDFGALLGLLGKYGTDPRNVLFIMDLWTYNKARQLDCFQTMDKVGSQATLLTGQLGVVYGVPVIVCPQMAKANATGQVDQTSGNNTKGRILAVNKQMYRAGLARPVQVRTQVDEPKTSTSIVTSFRLALASYGTRASATHTALGYDVTV